MEFYVMNRVSQIMSEQNRTEPTVYLELRSRAYQKLARFVANLSACGIPRFMLEDIADWVIEDISKAKSEDEIQAIFKEYKMFS